MCYNASVDLDFFNHLNCCKEAPDVTLIVEGTEIPAHRTVLSERCEYFKTMFSSSFVEANSERIVLKEINLIAFKVVLKFIYTGKLSKLYLECQVPNCEHDSHAIPLEQLFEIHKCAQYYMIAKLIDDTRSKFYKIGRIIPGLMLNYALSYSVDDLLLHYCGFIIQKDAHNLVENKIFKQLTPMALEYLLKYQLVTYESIIFEALVGWMRSNLNHSETFSKLLEHVELHLLDKAHLDMLFEPTQLIDPLFLENVLRQQRQQAQKIQTVIEQNIIKSYDPCIMDGIRKMVYVRRKTGETTITPLFPKDIIVIDLKQQFLLNCLKIDSVFSNSYVVSVSTDSQNWDVVIDHSKNEGSGPQNLYFEERAFRFIRIQSDTENFNISANIKAMYLTDASRFKIVDSNNAHTAI